MTANFLVARRTALVCYEMNIIRSEHPLYTTPPKNTCTPLPSTNIVIVYNMQNTAASSIQLLSRR